LQFFIQSLSERIRHMAKLQENAQKDADQRNIDILQTMNKYYQRETTELAVRCQYFRYFFLPKT